jgi:hypothetical protein
MRGQHVTEIKHLNWKHGLENRGLLRKIRE